MKGEEERAKKEAEMRFILVTVASVTVSVLLCPKPYMLKFSRGFYCEIVKKLAL